MGSYIGGHIYTLANCVCVCGGGGGEGRGYTVFTLSVCWFFFQYLEKAMTEFHKFVKHIDIHKMNIYNRKIRARVQIV